MGSRPGWGIWSQMEKGISPWLWWHNEVRTTAGAATTNSRPVKEQQGAWPPSLRTCVLSIRLSALHCWERICDDTTRAAAADCSSYTRPCLCLISQHKPRVFFCYLQRLTHFPERFFCLVVERLLWGLSSRMPGCRCICFWNDWELGGWLKWQGRWKESGNFFLASLLNWKLWGLLFLVFYVQNEVFKALDLTQTKRKVYSKIKSHFKWKIRLFSNKTAWFLLTYVYFLPERTKSPEPLGWLFSSTVKNLWSVKTFPWNISLSAPSEHFYVHQHQHVSSFRLQYWAHATHSFQDSSFDFDFSERLYKGLPKELGEIFSVPVAPVERRDHLFNFLFTAPISCVVSRVEMDWEGCSGVQSWFLYPCAWIYGRSCLFFPSDIWVLFYIMFPLLIQAVVQHLAVPADSQLWNIFFSLNRKACLGSWELPGVFLLVDFKCCAEALLSVVLFLAVAREELLPRVFFCASALSCCTNELSIGGHLFLPSPVCSTVWYPT